MHRWSELFIPTLLQRAPADAEVASHKFSLVRAGYIRRACGGDLLLTFFLATAPSTRLWASCARRMDKIGQENLLPRAASTGDLGGQRALVFDGRQPGFG